MSNICNLKDNLDKYGIDLQIFRNCYFSLMTIFIPKGWIKKVETKTQSFVSINMIGTVILVVFVEDLFFMYFTLCLQKELINLIL